MTKTYLDIFVGSAIGCGILVVAFSNFSELSLPVTSFWSACAATEIDDMGAFVPSPVKSRKHLIWTLATIGLIHYNLAALGCHRKIHFNFELFEF